MIGDAIAIDVRDAVELLNDDDLEVLRTNGIRPSGQRRESFQHAVRRRVAIVPDGIHNDDLVRGMTHSSAFSSRLSAVSYQRSAFGVRLAAVSVRIAVLSLQQRIGPAMSPKHTRLLLRVALGARLLAVATHTRADPDLFGNLRYGGDVVSARSAVLNDPYSYTGLGTFTNHEWLFQAIAFEAFDRLGTAGLLALK